MRYTGAFSVLLFAVAGLAAAADAATTQAPPDSQIVVEPAPDSLPGRVAPCTQRWTGSTIDVRAQRLFMSGVVDTSWVPDSTICSGPVAAFRSSKAADANGGYFLPTLRGGGDEPDIVLEHVTAEGTSLAGWPTLGLTVASAPNSQYHLDMAPDGAGGAYLVWEDYRAGGAGDIYAQRIAADGSAAPGWPENGLEICGAPGEQSLPSLAVVDGSVWIAWQDRRNGSLKVCVQRLASSGQPEAGWPQGGVLLTVPEPPVIAPILASDSSGSVVLIWQQLSAAGGRSLLALPITNMSPETGTSASPLSLSSSAQEFGDLTLINSGATGIFVCWSEQRGTPYGAVPAGFDHNALQYFNHPFVIPQSAITIGNVTLYGRGLYPSAMGFDGNLVGGHEEQHTRQGEQLGVFYLPSNAIGGTLAVIRGEGWHGPSNWNERGPQKHPPDKW